MAHIIFVHGMYMNPRCFDAWLEYAEARGHTAEAPAWPHHEGEPAILRREHPNRDLGRLTLGRVYEAIAAVVRRRGEDSVVIGHSMGGLIVQKLLAEGLGRAGVAINSAPPLGVISISKEFLRSNWPVLNPIAPPNAPILQTLDQFRYGFANDHSDGEVEELYSRYVVPESRWVGRGPLGLGAYVDFGKKRAPLLLTAGTSDRTIPLALNRANFRAYRKNPSRTDFLELPGRTHALLSDRGWREVADEIFGWLEKNAGIRASSEVAANV